MIAVIAFPEQGLLGLHWAKLIIYGITLSHPHVSMYVGSGTVLTTQRERGQLALAPAVTCPRSNCWNVIEQGFASGSVCV